ncbi:MAG: hypothetical protein U1E36_05295 [Rickettsiales bacterium]
MRFMHSLSLVLLLLPCTAGATPPLDADESVICTVSGKVFEFSDVHEKVTHIKDNISKYKDPEIWKSVYTRARIEVESVTLNPKSRYALNQLLTVDGYEAPKTGCAYFMKDMMSENFPICQKGAVPLKLGQPITVNVIGSNYQNNGGSPCLQIK